jgi:hypothetical protein
VKAGRKAKIASEEQAREYASQWIRRMKEEEEGGGGIPYFILSSRKARMLAAALLERRGKKGATINELDTVFHWATQIELQAATLSCVLAGSMKINVIDGKHVDCEPNVYVVRLQQKWDKMG